ncbi:MAG: hypothetical protein Q9187_006765 [Circinaria calcarea]
MEGLLSNSMSNPQPPSVTPQVLPIKRTASGRPRNKRFARQFTPSPSATASQQQHLDAPDNNGETNPFPPTKAWHAVQCLKEYFDDDIFRWLDYARFPNRNPIGSQYPQQRDSLTSSIYTRSSGFSVPSTRTSYSRQSLYSHHSFHDDLRPTVPALELPLNPPYASNNIEEYRRSTLNKDGPIRKRPPLPLPRYFCTFCDKAFGRKGDWKSHEMEFHERQEEYTCTECDKDYYFKHRFIRHHLNHHGCENCPHAETCRTTLPKKRAWGCGFCGQSFPTLPNRFEHIAEHYEAGTKRAEWKHSLMILGLLRQPDVVDPWSLILDRIGVSDWSTCFWSKEAASRLQNELELKGLKTGEMLAMDAYNNMTVDAKETEVIVAPTTWRSQDLTSDLISVASTSANDAGGGFNPESDRLANADIALLSLGRGSSAYYGYGPNQHSPRQNQSCYDSTDGAFTLDGFHFPRVPRHGSSFYEDTD